MAELLHKALPCPDFFSFENVTTDYARARRKGERERKNKKVKLRQSVQEIRLRKEEEEEGLCDIHDQCGRGSSSPRGKTT